MKNLQIETLRGFACVLLVSYHVIGGFKFDVGIYRDINEYLSYIRMPLFTFLSGWVYSIRPFSKGAGPFIISKARRLLLPMVTVGTLFAVLQSFVPGTNSTFQHWATIHLIPVAHFWFLEAIFTIFILIVILESLNLLQRTSTFFLTLILASIMFIVDIEAPYFALGGTFYLFPFFLLGMLNSRYLVNTDLKYSGPVIYSLLLVFSVLISFMNSELSDSRDLTALTISGSCCLLLQSLNLKSHFLSFIGKYSYSIFLFHIFFTAASRILMFKIGISNLHILFFLSLIIGTCGPIAVEIIVRKSPILRTFLIGSKLRK